MIEVCVKYINVNIFPTSIHEQSLGAVTSNMQILLLKYYFPLKGTSLVEEMADSTTETAQSV